MQLGFQTPQYAPYDSGGYYSAPSSPFSYTGAQAAGANIAATAGGVFHAVAAPVVGFGSGLLQGRAVLVLGIVAAAILLNRNSQ
jgi:hypothetical protein